MTILYVIIAVLLIIVAFYAGSQYRKNGGFWNLLLDVLASFFSVLCLVLAFFPHLGEQCANGFLWWPFVVSGLIFLASMLGLFGSSTSTSVASTNTGGSTKGNNTSANTFVAGVQSDDLKKIEGVGPVLAKFLNTNGYNLYQDVANADPVVLKNLLNTEGKRFQVHVTDTRPMQAKLCMDGKWDELKKLQDILDGGKLPS